MAERSLIMPLMGRLESVERHNGVVTDDGLQVGKTRQNWLHSVRAGRSPSTNTANDVTQVSTEYHISKIGDDVRLDWISKRITKKNRSRLRYPTLVISLKIRVRHQCAATI